jgi:FAD/FMN-containing dehydrogenase
MITASPGVISIQTISGAISTGTHGQGIFQSTISDAILKITIVNPKGKVYEIHR